MDKKSTLLDGTLQSIYVRLNSNLQNLTSKAIAQIIIKIVYVNNRSLTKQEIKDALAVVNDCKHINNNEVDQILENLVPQELKLNDGRYSLSTSKKESIKKSLEYSENRLSEILNKYFSELNSDKSIIIDWLNDVTIKFFEAYSDEWISDIMASTKNIVRSSDSIRTLITNRTNANKNLDKDDKVTLPSKFINFVLASDKLVEEYLWDYGTSAFASRLIRTMHGVDQLTLETFRDSICVLDTNILIFIALESRFKDAFTAIEKVFIDLGIKVKILYITLKEYENKISYQRYVTLQNMEKYGSDISMLPNDDFTEYLKSCRCSCTSDVERAFDIGLKCPSFIHDSLSIELLDNDQVLAEKIEEAQANESKKNALDSIFRNYTNHSKSNSALNHDIGLIEGVKYLRSDEKGDNEKYFVLSEEISVNQYSKEAGFKQNLPLSLRVDTLINLLAVNNGGDTFNSEDYVALFANIIRLGLVPHRDTFRQTELYQFYQMNSKIASLPKEVTKDIVISLHDEILKGINEDEIHRDLEEMITKGEIHVGKQLETTKEELDFSTREIERVKQEKDKIKSKLRRQILTAVTKEYDGETKKKKSWCMWKTPAIILLVSIALFCIYHFINDKSDLWISTSVGLIFNIFSTLICNLFGQFFILKDRKKNRERAINDETERRLNNELQDN